MPADSSNAQPPRAQPAIAEVESLPIGERAAAYLEVHRGLQDRLSAPSV